GLAGLPQVAGVEARRVLQQRQQPALLVAALLRLGRRLLVGDLDAEAVTQPLHGGDEVEVLGVLDEADGVAAALAAETVVLLVDGVDRERRRALVVERAASGV